MVVDLSAGEVHHRRVGDLGEYLGPGDCLVLNNTRVLAARFNCMRVDTGGKLEGLLMEQVAARRWWTMLRKSRRLQPGHQLQLLEHDGTASGELFQVVELHDGRVLLELTGERPVEEILGRLGEVPLPPYIRNARRDAGEPIEDLRDRDWYQTVYAREDGLARSVAAPTAGLHLSRPMLASLEQAGVRTAELELEVGAGTFKPVEADTLEEHPMHSERCVVPAVTIETLRSLQIPRAEGRARIIPVGTTATRTLESLPIELPAPSAGPLAYETDLLIEPGFDFRYLDGLLTNFHLPRSTLLALVGAVCGMDRLKSLYQEAIDEGYRFFSYGDAMLLIASRNP